MVFACLVSALYLYLHVFFLFALADAFNKDKDPKKVSLGVGAYRGDDGKPFVLNTVRKAEKIVLEKALNHEYAGIAGEACHSSRARPPYRGGALLCEPLT